MDELLENRNVASHSPFFLLGAKHSKQIHENSSDPRKWLRQLKASWSWLLISQLILIIIIIIVHEGIAMVSTGNSGHAMVALVAETSLQCTGTLHPLASSAQKRWALPRAQDVAMLMACAGPKTMATLFPIISGKTCESHGKDKPSTDVLSSLQTLGWNDEASRYLDDRLLTHFFLASLLADAKGVGQSAPMIAMAGARLDPKGTYAWHHGSPKFGARAVVPATPLSNSLWRSSMSRLPRQPRCTFPTCWGTQCIWFDHPLTFSWSLTPLWSRNPLFPNLIPKSLRFSPSNSHDRHFLAPNWWKISKPFLLKADSSSVLLNDGGDGGLQSHKPSRPSLGSWPIRSAAA